MADEEDLTQQADEIEALSAIYGDQWCVEDAASRTYSINISDDPDNPKYTVNLQVTLPTDYPSKSPPQYQIGAPWLRGHDRQDLANQLEEEYCANIGEIILYLWVEKIREFLVSKAAGSDSPRSTHTESAIQECSQQLSEQVIDNFVEEEDLNLSDMAAYQDEQLGRGDHNQANEDIKLPEIFHGDPLTDRRSHFQAHLAPIHHKEQVKMVLDKLYENKKIAIATHNIIAYRIIKEGQSTVIQGCRDDGETHAGSRMLHLLQIIDAKNVMVVVTRWYGGVHLGPDRFKHINNLTRIILEKHGYVREKEEKKKGPRSNKKNR